MHAAGKRRLMNRMHMNKFSRLIFWVLAAGLLSACSFSLAGDVTPPPGAEQSIEPTAQPIEDEGAVFPLTPPDVTNGEAIYTEKCAPCHGSTGKGDGERASQLPNPPPALASVNVSRQATPADWFIMVTRGNLERSMPPFPSLSDSQRWDVVAYAFSLRTTIEDYERGKQIYDANCAGCHGLDGKGDGANAGGLSRQPADLTDLALMAEKSGVDLFQTISNGIPPVMPAFDTLAEDERLLLVDYLRSFTFAVPPAISGMATPSSTGNAEEIVTVTPTAVGTKEVGTVIGTITNGSGGETPAGLEVMLWGFDTSEQVLTQTVKCDTQGTFRFREVELLEGRVFVSLVDFSGTTYVSDFSIASAGTNELELPITVYETTNDASVIKIDRLHLFFELLDENTMRVVELNIMSNTSNKTVMPVSETEPVVRFKLPVGSSNLEFQDGVLGGRYLETPDGFGDLMPVLPGSATHQVLFAFEMPYNRRLDFVQSTVLPVDAVVVLVPEDNVRIRGEAIQDEGVRDLQGVNYHQYNVGNLLAGDDLHLTMTGSLAAGKNSRNNLIIGLSVLGIAVVLTGAWLYRHVRLREISEAEELELAVASLAPESTDLLMDAIIALDDQFQNGELPEEAYKKRRLELRMRLQEAIETQEAAKAD
jgi:mono/diheme cytochrome c family protein